MLLVLLFVVVIIVTFPFVLAGGFLLLGLRRGMKFMRLIIFRLFLVLIAATCGVMALNRASYCIAEQRFISDEEKIAAAVAYVMRKPTWVVTDYVPGRSISRSVPALKYASRDEFMAANPGCCRIGPEGGDEYPEPTLFRRVTGELSDIVVVEFKVIDTNGQERSLRTQWAVTSCGRVNSSI